MKKVTNQELLERIEKLEKKLDEILKYSSCIEKGKEAKLENKVCRESVERLEDTTDIIMPHLNLNDL